jgi:hypothetical protein
VNSIAWFQIGTDDRFYGDLLGWSFRDDPTAEAHPYGTVRRPRRVLRGRVQYEHRHGYLARYDLISENHVGLAPSTDINL